MPNLSVGSIYLGDHDHDWFIVMSRLGSQNSIRGNLSSIVGYYVRRRKHEYTEVINYAAAKNGLSPQETFKRALKNYPLNEPLKEGQSVDDIPDLEMSEEITQEVNIGISPEIYEVLEVQARQKGIAIADLIKEKFGM